VREAQAAARLKHPHIAAVHEVGEAGLQVWIASEYIAGDSLAAWLRKHDSEVAPRAAAAFLVPLAEAVDFAHGAGVLHRDLKPSNILVGKAGKLKIAGFGLGALRVRELDPSDGYPSPEFLGGAPFGIRADIYALGALIFHALTGQNPGQGASANGSPPRLKQILPEAPDALDRILAQCLMQDPAQRFATSGELLSAAKSVQA
jgi:serine/threonine-protein kinase